MDTLHVFVFFNQKVHYKLEFRAASAMIHVQKDRQGAPTSSMLRNGLFLYVEAADIRICVLKYVGRLNSCFALWLEQCARETSSIARDPGTLQFESIKRRSQKGFVSPPSRGASEFRVAKAAFTTYR